MMNKTLCKAINHIIDGALILAHELREDNDDWSFESAIKYDLLIVDLAKVQNRLNELLGKES